MTASCRSGGLGTGFGQYRLEPRAVLCIEHAQRPARRPNRSPENVEPGMGDADMRFGADDVTDGE